MSILSIGMLLIVGSGVENTLDALRDLRPEMDRLSVRNSGPQRMEFPSIEVGYLRDDGASFWVRTHRFKSLENRFGTILSAVESNMQGIKPGPDSAVRKMPSGLPGGDQIYNWVYGGGPHSKSSDLTVGVENVDVRLKVQYRNSVVNGERVFEIEDWARDKLLIEDLSRRVLGRLLAFEHLAAIRNNSLSANVSEVVDDSGKRFISLPNWASSNSVSQTPERKIGHKFTYHGKSVFVLLSANVMKVGEDWRPLGGYVMEVNNKLFVPKTGFLESLP